VLEAANEARKQALAIVAQELEASVEDLEIVGENVQVKGVPDRKVTLADVARMSTSKYKPVWGNGASAQQVIAAGFAAHSPISAWTRIRAKWRSSITSPRRTSATP
jgi:hypothetical protein